MSTRRDLLKLACTIAAGAALPACAARKQPGTLLILGGTGFIGPHLTTLALAGGWRVTHFNRGKRAPGGTPGVETLIGDRNGQLEALRGRRWDAVIDDTGYVPRQVRQSAQLLASQAGYCLFISSISAYASFAQANDENSPTGTLADKEANEMTGDTYGPMKALCEQYTREIFKDRSCIVRPGFIVGPLDPTDRFTYWPVRASRGGQMLAPGTPKDPIQVIDVRDLAAWLLHLVETRTAGTFNAVSAPHAFTMGDLIGTSLAASPGAHTEVTWVPEQFLAAHWKPDDLVVTPWAPSTGEYAGLPLTSAARALAAGLKIRALADTVRDTLAWFQTLPPERQAKLQAGLDAQKETETLALWHARTP